MRVVSTVHNTGTPGSCFVMQHLGASGCIFVMKPQHRPRLLNLQYHLDMMVCLAIENIPLSAGVEISYSNCSQSLADRRYDWGGGKVVNLISRPPTVQLGL